MIRFISTLAAVSALLLGLPLSGFAQTGQTGGQTGGQAAGQQTGEAKAETGDKGEKSEEEADEEKASQKKPDINFGNIELYGYRIFLPARIRIDEYRRSLAAGGPAASAFESPVGPLLPPVNATPPATYQLGPGDSLKVRMWSPTLQVKESIIEIDREGRATAPGSQRQVVLRGQTLSQAESMLKTEAGRAINNASVTVELEALRTFSVTIIGDSYLPGTYEVPAMTTLFNLIYATGGPSNTGTMRSILVKRQHEETISVDLYGLIMHGDDSQDVKLQPGDMVLIPPARTKIRVTGEVLRPAVYELKTTETLLDAVQLAGGVKPSGVSQSISIDSIVPGQARVQIDVDLLSDEAAKTVLFDGDQVEITSIRPETVNAVRIEGAVDQPRTYALTDDMKLSDLIRGARGLLADAYLSMAHIRRRADDRSLVQITVDLGKAMAGDPEHDVPLKSFDAVRIYSIREVGWFQDARVSIRGAVKRAETFNRAEGMTVVDLITMAGGVRPDADMTLAFIQRVNPDGTPGELKKINLLKARNNDPEHNIVLQDLDVLEIYTIGQSADSAAQKVDIFGAVQTPDKYTLASGMRVKDLIQLAGGPLLNAHLERAYLQRQNEDGTEGELFAIDVRGLMAGDETQNIELSPGDRLTIYSTAQAIAQVEGLVTITGAVQTAGPFRRSTNLTVKDLIGLAGGLTLDASPEKAFLQRKNTDGTVGRLLVIDINKALEGDPEHDVPLQDQDELMVYTKDQAAVQYPESVRITGAVQNGGFYQRGKGMTIRDLISMAGGTLFNSGDVVEIARARQTEGSKVMQLSLKAVMSSDAANVLLQDGDIVSIMADSSILETPLMVELKGEVARPGLYMVTRRDERLSEIIERAGGLTSHAWSDGLQFARDPSDLTTPLQDLVKPRMVQVMGMIQENAYTRAFARSEMEKVRFANEQGGGQQPSILPMASAPYAAPAQQAPADLSSLGQLVSKARTGGPESVLGGNLHIDLEEALKRPGSPDDLLLKDGDIITVPEMPSTVLVSGPGVLLSQGVVYRPGKDLNWYVKQAGGLAPDADKDLVMIIRPSGVLLKPRMSTRIKQGDVIYVPTEVMRTRLGDSVSDFERIVRSITNGALLFGVFQALTK